MWRGKVVTPRHYILTADWDLWPQQSSRKLRIRNTQASPGGFGTSLLANDGIRWLLRGDQAA